MPSLRSLRWVIAHRAWSGYHLRAYARYCWLRIRRPYVQTEGLIFLGRGVQLRARRGYGRLIIGRYAHIGDGTALRAHEGTLRIGAKAVLAADVTVNCYLHVEIGPASLVADDVYICDFDHRHEDLSRPIKDQGIVKAPVRIGADVWIGTKTTILRGVDVGRGSVVGASSVVTRDIPAYAIAAGSPARIIGSRRPASPQLDPPMAKSTARISDTFPHAHKEPPVRPRPTPAPSEPDACESSAPQT